MPSTYTTNLGIEKIATGEQSGTWGTTTNTNLDLLDEAVNGIVSVTLSSAGSSGSPTALPITDGSSSTGRNKFIEFTDGGDLGGTAYVQLTPNDAEKVVHIRNSLSGSRAVIVFQGTYNASNDFQIENGKDVLLKFSGTGSGATVTDVFVDLAATKIDPTTLSIGGTAVTSTAAELNILDGVTATAAELNKLDGVTATTAELNYVDVTTLGTVQASKAVTADSSGEIKVPDDKRIIFGNDSDATIAYDETTDNRLEIAGSTVHVAKNAIGTVTAENDGSFDLSASNHFTCTPTGAIDLTFTNEVAGQSGSILLVNTTPQVVTVDADVFLSATDLTAINVAGTYLMSYYSPDGTNVYLAATPALTEGS